MNSEPRYTDIQVMDECYVSSSKDYLVYVLMRKDRRYMPRQTFHLNSFSFTDTQGLSHKPIPRYVVREVLQQILTKLERATLRFFEVDQHDQKQYTDLKTFDPTFIETFKQQANAQLTAINSQAVL